MGRHGDATIVYVVVCGGEDYYYRQLLLSVRSLKYNSPGSKVEIVADADTACFLQREQNEVLKGVSIKVVAVPAELENTRKSRWLKTSLRKWVSGDFLFIDTDTLVADNLCGIDRIKADIAAVTGSHGSPDRLLSGKVKALLQAAGFVHWGDGPYYNTGVLLVKDTPAAYSFYERWHSNWQKAVTSSGIVFDQPSFFGTNMEMGCPVSRLPDKWNCMIRSDMGIHFFKTANIVHWYSKNECMQQFVNGHVKDGKLDDTAIQLARFPKKRLAQYRPKEKTRLYNRLYAHVLYFLRDHLRLFGWAEKLNRKLIGH